jgi:hypothetical protein
VIVPCFEVVTIPPELTFATVVSEVCHVTLLIGCELPSEYFPAALYCCVRPAATLAVPGVTTMDWSVGPAGPVEDVVEPPPPQEKSNQTQDKATAQTKCLFDMIVYPSNLIFLRNLLFCLRAVTLGMSVQDTSSEQGKGMIQTVHVTGMVRDFGGFVKAHLRRPLADSQHITGFSCFPPCSRSNLSSPGPF